MGIWKGSILGSGFSSALRRTGVFFGALSEMLIPELTGAQMRKDQAAMDRTASRILSACLLFSGAVAGLLFLLGPWLGRRLYRSAEAGLYIRTLSPLVIVMYLDSVIIGYPFAATMPTVFFRILSGVLIAVAFSFILPPLLNALKKLTSGS